MNHSFVNPSESPVSKQVNKAFNFSRLERITTDSRDSEGESEVAEASASDLLASGCLEEDEEDEEET